MHFVKFYSVDLTTTSLILLIIFIAQIKPMDSSGTVAKMKIDYILPLVNAKLYRVVKNLYELLIALK